MVKRNIKKPSPGNYEDLAKYDKRRTKRKFGAPIEKALENSFELVGDEWEEKKISEKLFVARVVEVHKRYSFISPEDANGNIDTRDVWIATVAKKYLQTHRKSRNFVCVGDLVLCRRTLEGEHQVSEELPHCSIEFLKKRSSTIRRLDPMTQERIHILASNIDQLVIVASYLNPTIKWGLIDRYLVLAESEHIDIVIIFNKKDLLAVSEKLEFKQECANYLNLYKNLGYKIFEFQADKDDSEENIEILKNIFPGKVSLVSGHSGVGKSSIVNLMRPEIEQDVEKDDIFFKGRHTTSYASLIKLGIGGYVVDSPGIRSFTIEEKDAIELSWCFVEMRPYLGKCKYRECRHMDEPECAIKDAVKEKIITEERYKSYLGILTGATGREGRLRDIQI